MTNPIQATTIEIVKNAGDVASVGIVLATFGSWLPPIAVITTIVWTVFRIIEARSNARLNKLNELILLKQLEKSNEETE